MKFIGGGGIVAVLVAVVLGYSLLSGPGESSAGSSAGSTSGSGLDGLQDAKFVERVKAEIAQVVSDVLPDGLADLLPEGVPVPSVGSGPSSAKGAPVPPSAAEARQQLAGLRVAPAKPGSMAGYSREAFPHWETAVDFGWQVDPSCDAREAALIRDGRKVVVGEYCEVESGRWVDPLAGGVLTDPGDVDIDHHVPLANAWRSGASTWSTADREAYANDPHVLIATDDGQNQAKGDKGPEAWRPPNGLIHCEYARRWIDVKSDWGLSVSPAEKSALREMLATC